MTSQAWTVAVMRRVGAIGDAISVPRIRRALGRRSSDVTWPTVPGRYVVGDPRAPLAVCALTSTELLAPLAAMPGVAIAGRVYTPNLGIERLVRNVVANPSIRMLLVCGRESPVFQVGQALLALASGGVAEDGTIVGATGLMPAVGLPRPLIERFRAWVSIVDSRGSTGLAELSQEVEELVARSDSDAASVVRSVVPGPELQDAVGGGSRFTAIRPGGHREPLGLDPAGFFVVTVDGSEIVVQHYLADRTPAHEMRGHGSESMLLGLLREGLISQLSHAGYMGAELDKAETAIRLGLVYEQDRPLQRGHGGSSW